MILKLFFFLLFSINSYAGTLLSNTGASFSSSTVSIRVASNADCTQAGISKQEIIDLITPSINDYWNTVSTSRLKLINKKEFSTTNALFNTGTLCTDESTEVKCTGVTNPIPKVEGILITCNSNVQNFSTSGLNPQEVLAITLPNNIVGSTFLGSVILINNTASSPFKNLTQDEKQAVIAHEIGHAIGLGHSENDGNLMFWTPTPKRFSLGPDDADSLTYLYPKRFDGCGIAGTTKDSSGNDHFFIQILLSFFLSLGFFIVFQKVFFKFNKAIL